MMADGVYAENLDYEIFTFTHNFILLPNFYEHLYMHFIIWPAKWKF